ncbi:MAG: alpha amylase C-terminal domain-containing protein [Cytophagales bacterium]|nr:alpha amylase C-terminal domain-containing protein [Armatimonadota bacterium]
MTPDEPIPLVQQDPWLEPFSGALRWRGERYQAARAAFEENGGLRGAISEGHHYFGMNRGERDGQPGIWYREWAPGAQALFLTGDFNQWSREADALARDPWGVWSRFLPDAQYADTLTHGSLLKVRVRGADGSERDRIPAYARRVVQDAQSKDFTAQFWMPPTPFSFTKDPPGLPEREGLRIYEAHVGMAQEEGRTGSFDEFTETVLPRVARLGYNALQLMAIQEHPYYGSFGYHVSSFFAVSSRFGTPEALKRLIDTAHGLGIVVLLDLVHSHAVKNLNEGLNRFDGTDYQYFHAGGRGLHSAWDSLLFDYAKYEVQRFLLSNVRYWLEEFRFDGFRFDGVTSMLYRDHGLSRDFVRYADYFGSNMDEDAVTYLQLATDLAHAINPKAVIIAEDMSGMPGTARPVADGGLGFDYRLAMGVPDFWIKLVKETPDEQWSLGKIYQTLLDRRWNEKHVGYAESHDQALVGDQTLAFRMMGAEMYSGMAHDHQSLVVDRGIALHKILRLLTFSLAGEAYLSFLGNEFGHPEWVDFPREGNHFSYHFARRQWSLADNPHLRYGGLNAFDAAMQKLDQRFHILPAKLIEQLVLHEDTRQLVYRRGPLVFVVNLHPTQSYSGLRIPVPDAEDYRLVLNSDDRAFAGAGRGDESGSGIYPLQNIPMYGRDQSLQIYLPSRSAQVLAPISSE